MTTTFRKLIEVPIYGPKVEAWIQENVKYATKKGQGYFDNEGRLDPFMYDDAGNLIELLADTKTVKDFKNPGKEITLSPTYFLQTRRLQTSQVPFMQVIEQVSMKIKDEKKLDQNGKPNPSYGKIVNAEVIAHVMTSVRHIIEDTGKDFGLPIAFRFLDQVLDDDGAYHYRQAGVTTVDAKGNEMFVPNVVPKQDWYGVLTNGWQCLGHGATSVYTTSDQEIHGLKNLLFNTDPTICPLRVKGRTKFEGVTASDIESAFDLS